MNWLQNTFVVKFYIWFGKDENKIELEVEKRHCGNESVNDVLMSSNTKWTVIHRELIMCRRRPLVHSKQPDICGARGPCFHFWLNLSSDDGLILKGKYTRTPWQDPISTRHFLTKQKPSLGENAFYYNSSRSESHVDSGKCRFWWVHQQNGIKTHTKTNPKSHSD